MLDTGGTYLGSFCPAELRLIAGVTLGGSTRLLGLSKEGSTTCLNERYGVGDPAIVDRDCTELVRFRWPPNGSGGGRGYILIRLATESMRVLIRLLIVGTKLASAVSLLYK